MENILPAIKNRRSIVSFSDQVIEADKLQRLFEAARWAPSSFNEQPWRFLVADKKDDQEEHKKVASVLLEANRVWAENAPVLVLPLAVKTFSKTGMPNKFSFYDTGQAVAHLSLQATAEGLYLHQMGGFDADKARELLNIPDDLEPTAVIAIGYKGERPELTEEVRYKENKERVRKGLKEIVFNSFN